MAAKISRNLFDRMLFPVHISILLLVLYFVQTVQTAPSRIIQHHQNFINIQVHNKFSRRVPRSPCSSVQYYNETTASCKECNLCPSGYYASTRCGYGGGGWAVCMKCQDGRFSQGGTQAFCKECLDCAALKRETEKACGPQHDTKCGVCLEGYESLYRDAVDPTIHPCSPQTAQLSGEGGWEEARKWKIVAIVCICTLLLMLLIPALYYCLKQHGTMRGREVQERQPPKPYQNGNGVLRVDSPETDPLVNSTNTESGEHTVRFTDRQSERLVDAQPPGRPRLSNTDVDGASPFLGRRTDTAEWRDAEAGGGPHPPHDRLEGEGSDEGVRVRGNGASESANPRHDESDGGRRPRSGRIGGASGDPGVGRRSTPTGRDRPALTRHESPQSTTGHTTNVTIVNNNSVLVSPVPHAAANPVNTTPHGAGQPNGGSHGAGQPNGGSHGAGQPNGGSHGAGQPNEGPAHLTGVTGTPTGTTTEARPETGEADLQLPQQEEGQGDSDSSDTESRELP